MVAYLRLLLKQRMLEIIVVFDAMYVPGLSKVMNSTVYKLFGLMKVRTADSILKLWLEKSTEHVWLK